MASALLLAALTLTPATARAPANLRTPRPPTMLAAPLDNAAPKVNSDETYDLMMNTLLQTEADIPGQISANYKLIDYGFLQRLGERIAKQDPKEAERLAVIQTACNDEMGRRMQEAAQSLKDILSSPTAVVMEGKMAGLARQGKVDDALLQLLEANLQQARAAGDQGKNAANALAALQTRVQNELDKTLSPTQALLRQLLRMDSKPARLALLKDKMSPKQKSSVLLASEADDAREKKEDETKPDVDPRDFAEALITLKGRFGNVDENYDTGFVAKAEMVADEAESVARDIAGGREVTAKEQQDMMWNTGSISVWDLEQVELQARENNAVAVWEEEGIRQVERDNAARMKGFQSE